MKPGRVSLIGAGPGDVELLTLKAVRALGSADVVLIDDLANEDVLQFVRTDARVVRVGKRGGCRSTPQDFIERLMLRYARAGKCVARIKGGDPFVFGRGAEELQRMRAAGIACDVIAGITAGIAAPMALDIPVTHRGACDGVTFVTGHTQDGREPEWEALARSRTTLVIYMGMAKLDRIVTLLRAAGMDACTPAAVIQNATTSAQRSVVSTLDGLVAAVNDAALGSPAIVVIGEVVGLAAQQALEAVGAGVAIAA